MCKEIETGYYCGCGCKCDYQYDYKRACLNCKKQKEKCPCLNYD